MEIAIISFYKFVPLTDPKGLADQLCRLGEALEIKGTILIASEGINATVAGQIDEIERLKSFLKSQAGFEDLVFKTSFWSEKPFKRFLVKVKAEIITFRGAQVAPAKETGKYVSPEELRAWLGNKENLILVDTRNAFEVETGTFKGALNPKIANFSQFKDFVETLSSRKDQRIVTFCTGGIRCEKATAYMIEQGFSDVYQLEGGILEYLDKTDGAYFEGSCFVFDERIALDKNLKPDPVALESKKA